MSQKRSRSEVKSGPPYFMLIGCDKLVSERTPQDHVGASIQLKHFKTAILDREFRGPSQTWSDNL